MIATIIIVASSAYRVPSLSSYAQVSLRDELTEVRDWFFFLLLVCTVLVALGVALEEADNWLPSGKPRLNMLRGSFSPSPWVEWKKRLGRLGWILILLGVIGEGLFEGATSWADSKLQDWSNSLLLNSEALTGNAAKSAKIAGDEARAAKADATAAHEEADDAKESSKKALAISNAASNVAGTAQDKAGEVAKQAHELRDDLQSAKTKLEEVDAKRAELEKSLINLAICNAPRVISPLFLSGGLTGQKSYVDSLLPMHSQTVFIEVVPDAESRRAALSISRTLTDARWNVQPLKSVDDLKDGVSVQPSVSRSGDSADDFMRSIPFREQADDVAMKLVDFLRSYNWQAAKESPTDSKGHSINDDKILPMGAIRIQVGLYPPNIFVSPPGARGLVEAEAKATQTLDKSMKQYLAERDKETLKGLTGSAYAEAKAKLDNWRASVKAFEDRCPCQ
jgi:hypothetical protein